MPADHDALSDAVQWVENLLTGTIATAVAVIAIAAIGLGMLAGRLAWRNGAMVVLGCFVVFGAPAIAAGIADIATAAVDEARPPRNLPEPVRPLASIKAVPPSNYDPYTGAAVAPQ